MIIYFDESYDPERQYLILGAAFHPRSKSLNRELTKIKRANSFVNDDGTMKELK